MTPCERLKQTLFDFLDADVDSVGRHHVERHLKECSHCSKWFNQIKRQKEFLKKLKPIRTRDHFVILLRERIRREMAGKTHSSGAFAGFSWLRAAVYALALLTLTVTARLLDKHLMKHSAVPKIAETSGLNGSPSNATHYVIDDFHSASGQPLMKKELMAQAARDTLKKSDASRDSSVDSNFEELRSRMAPVNF